MAYFARYMLDESGNLRKVVINAGVGFCLPFYGTEAPPGTLACDGSEISRATYSELFDVLGTKAGAGDGVSTFNLPDLRGMFIRGTGGNAAGLGVEQEDAIREISGKLGYPIDGWSVYADGIFVGTPKSASAASNLRGTQQGNIDYSNVEIDLSTQVPVASEVRPVNVALLWCIIYE